MKSYRIDVSGQEQFLAAQEALFKQGYGWALGGKELQNWTGIVSLFTDSDGKITYSKTRDYVRRMPEDYLVFSADGLSLVEPAPVQIALPLGVFQAPARQTALSRGSDPSTSKAAGMSFDPTALELEVLGAIRSFGEDGATQDDVLTKLRRISHSSITPRFRPLLNKGLVVDTGFKRKGVSGRGQRVMVAT